MTTGPVTSNGKLSYARFATKVVDDLYVYEQFAINPHINIASALGSSAFSELNVALYGPERHPSVRRTCSSRRPTSCC